MKSSALATSAAFAGAFSTESLLAMESSGTSQRLLEGWQYYRGVLSGIWEVWGGSKNSDNLPWTPVTLPHCFNARDSVDPDELYYQGVGWYRIKLKVENPFANGRTLLHFEGAGQKSEIFVAGKGSTGMSAGMTSS